MERNAGQIRTTRAERPLEPAGSRRPRAGAPSPSCPRQRGRARAPARRPIRGPRALHLRVWLRVRGPGHDLGRLPALRAHSGLVELLGPAPLPRSVGQDSAAPAIVVDLDRVSFMERFLSFVPSIQTESITANRSPG